MIIRSRWPDTRRWLSLLTKRVIDAGCQIRLSTVALCSGLLLFRLGWWNRLTLTQAMDKVDILGSLHHSWSPLDS